MNYKKISTILILFIFSLSLMPKIIMAADYSYDQTILGLGVDQVNPAQINIVDEQSSFSSADTIYVLTQLSNITDTASFRVRHEVLANGSSVYATNYTPIFHPYNYTWEYTNTWTEFSGLLAGNHQIRVSISIDGGVYEEVDIINFSVTGVSGNFDYVGTDTGLGIDHVSESEILIRDETSTFTDRQSIVVLTKIANIRNIAYFNFRHVIMDDDQNVVIDVNTNSYNPNNQTWAITHGWNGIPSLPAGDYTLQVSIRVDGEAYQILETKPITVTGTVGSYSYDSTNIGLGVRDAGNDEYEIIDGNNTFVSSDSIFVLSSLSNIQSVNSFQVKHVILDSNQNAVKTLTTPLFTPGGYFWGNTDTWTEMGRLPAGNYSVRAWVSLNGEAYMLESVVNITVTGSLNNYNYNDTVLGVGVLTLDSGQVQIIGQSSSFLESENIKALTIVSDIDNITTFQIRHEVFAFGQTLFKTLESPLFQPNSQFWSETTTWTEIGQLPVGEHTIRASISINGGTYQELETVNVSIN